MNLIINEFEKTWRIDTETLCDTYEKCIENYDFSNIDLNNKHLYILNDSLTGLVKIKSVNIHDYSVTNLIVNKVTKDWHISSFSTLGENEILIENFDCSKIDLNNSQLYSVNDDLTDLEFNLKFFKEKKYDEINQACEKAIISGFVSSTLGSDHFYYSTIAEQSTLNSLINLGVPNNFKAQKISIVEEKEVRAERVQHLHMIEQLKEVLKDGAIHIATQVAKKDLLEKQIQNATTVEEIEAISWEAV